MAERRLRAIIAALIDRLFARDRRTADDPARDFSDFFGQANGPTRFSGGSGR